MRIQRFGITLVRLTEQHIEMVRQWRNAPRISEFMEFRETITPAMQQAWYHALDELRDFYFVIEYHSEPVGLIHTSHIDWKEKTGHSGLFIHKNELLGTHVPVLASLSMVDFFFSFCNLETLFAKVLDENAVAVKYNAALGFKPAEPEGNRFRHYRLRKEDYFTATAHLRTLAKALDSCDNILEIERGLYNRLQSENVFSPLKTGMEIKFF